MYLKVSHTFSGLLAVFLGKFWIVCHGSWCSPPVLFFTFNPENMSHNTVLDFKLCLTFLFQGDLNCSRKEAAEGRGGGCSLSISNTYSLWLCSETPFPGFLFHILVSSKGISNPPQLQKAVSKYPEIDSIFTIGGFLEVR